MKKINFLGIVFIFITMFVITACNSGNNNAVQKVGYGSNFMNSNESGSNESGSNDSGDIAAPFNGRTGYDTIHHRQAEESCYEKVPSWQVIDGAANISLYTYLTNVNAISTKLGLKAHLSFRDSNNLIIEKDSADINSTIAANYSSLWQSDSLNLYGLSTRTWTVDFTPKEVDGFISSSGTTLLNSNGQSVESTAVEMEASDPKKAYLYFVDMCGNALPSSWNYKAYVVEHLSFYNKDFNFTAGLNDSSSGSGEASAPGESIGENGTSDLQALLNEATGSTSMQYGVIGTGNIGGVNLNSCNTKDSTSCFSEMVTPFFQSISEWTNNNTRSGSTGSYASEPYPGSTVLPPSAWDGTYQLTSFDASITNALGINMGTGPSVDLPSTSVYAKKMDSIERSYQKALVELKLVNDLESQNICSSMYPSGIGEVQSCNTTLKGIQTNLQNFVNLINDVSSGGHGSQLGLDFHLKEHCFYLKGGDPDGKKCNEDLDKILNYGLRNSLSILLSYQNRLHETILVHNVPRANESGTVSDNIIYLNPYSNKSGLTHVLKYYSGSFNPKYWGGNTITPDYLVADYGNYTAIGKLTNNGIYNIFVGNAQFGPNNVDPNKINSSYVVLGGYSEPLNNQGLSVYTFGNDLFSLDGYHLMGNRDVAFETKTFVPDDYIYAECDGTCPKNVSGYVVIVSLTYELHEYALIKDDSTNSLFPYHLVEVWNSGNLGGSINSPVIKFNTSTGLFNITSSLNHYTKRQIVIADPNSCAYDNQDNSACLDDHVRRYGLGITANGILTEYKYNSESPVWTNTINTQESSSEHDIPNVDSGSIFYYPYNLSESQ